MAATRLVAAADGRIPFGSSKALLKDLRLRGGEMDTKALLPSMRRLKDAGLEINELRRLAAQHDWSNAAGKMDHFISSLYDTKPQSQLKHKHAARLQQDKPKVAMFMHSLERNGANNFCLHLMSKLTASQSFAVVYAPKEGPMRADLEALGLKVEIMDVAAPDFLPSLQQRLHDEGIGMVFANTIMRCDVVNLAHKMGLPTLWVIHEAWPQDQLEHYANEVFMMKSLSADMIKEAFANCGCVVFPSNVQKDIYKGLYKEDAACTVYNGIPLKKLDDFMKSNERDAVRSQLGYGPDDFVVLHLGTICNRKGQLYTVKACSRLVNEMGCKDLKCLMVGARYIRDHEIEYIEQLKKEAKANDMSYARWEDTDEDQRGQARLTVMDIQADVTRYYMAADVVLVPSLNEVLPLVIGEAMAFNKPVVCSAIDGIPEAVDHQVDGLLVPPADAQALSDAIYKLHQSPELRNNIGKAGRDRVLRQFSYDVMASNYDKIMNKLVTKTPSLRGSSASTPSRQARDHHRHGVRLARQAAAA